MEKNKRRFITSVFVQDIFAVPIARFCVNVGIPANLVTALGLFCSLSSGWLYFEREYILGAGLFFLALILDSSDGRVARATGSFSKFGAMLDSLADKVRSFLVALLFIASLELPAIEAIVLFVFYISLPLLRIFLSRNDKDFYDPTILVWDASPLRDWFVKTGTLGLYNGWERAVVALIVAPLSPFPVVTFVSAVVVEQLLFFIGLIFFRHAKVGIEL